MLTITRPERRNAVDDETAAALLERFHEFEADDEARALVLTGEGPEAFCAGADLKAFAERAAEVQGDDPQAAIDAWLDAAAGRPLGFTRLTGVEADDRRDLGLVPCRRARAGALVRPAGRDHGRAGSGSPSGASACR